MPKGSWREFEDLDSQDTDQKPQNIQSKIGRTVRIKPVRGGRGGKTVTIINGLGLNDAELRKLLKKLKKTCGTGGTVKTDIIELQGDQVKTSIDFLQNEGFNPKQSGG